MQEPAFQRTKPDTKNQPENQNKNGNGKRKMVSNIFSRRTGIWKLRWCNLQAMQMWQIVKESNRQLPDVVAIQIAAHRQIDREIEK